MKLREAHLRYLLAIADLQGDAAKSVGTVEIANYLQCTKASVSNMISNLMEMGLLVRERYGKIDLTEEGICIAREAAACVGKICRQLAALDLPTEEIKNIAILSAASVSAASRAKLAGRLEADLIC